MKKIDKSEFVKAKVNVHLTPGEALKILRDLQGLTQKALGDLCGWEQSNISALESGRQQMGRERAIMLGKALKVHPAVLLFPDISANEVAS